MKLTTPIKIDEVKNQIDYQSKVLFLGSCFAENIGAKFAYYKFQCYENPFGILFHPIALERIITRAINDTWFTEKDVFFENELWHCFEVHSQCSRSSQEQLLTSLNAQLKELNKWLTEASHLVVTYGTSWVYRHIETDTIVANCHKMPQKKFLKELCSPEEVNGALAAIEVLVRTINPSIILIHTVSPVRHIKDGLIENSSSKANLISGVQEHVDPRMKNHYFPAYEIMMDELRDYRFYQQDLIHPNKTAITIIWEKFRDVWVAAETLALQKQIDVIQKGLMHRPFNVASEAYSAFKKDLATKISVVKTKLPHAHFR